MYLWKLHLFFSSIQQRNELNVSTEVNEDVSNNIMLNKTHEIYAAIEKHKLMC